MIDGTLPQLMGLGGKSYIDARPSKSKQNQPTLAEVLRAIRPNLPFTLSNGGLQADLNPPGAVGPQSAINTPQYNDPYMQGQYATDLQTYNRPLPSAPNPYAEKMAEIQGQQAGISQQLGMPDTTPEHQFTPYTPPPPIPYSPPSIPQRETPQFNPVAGGLAALSGFLAPQGAAQFNDAALGGSIQQANQHYQDAMVRHQLQLQDYQAEHAQKVQDRNEAIEIGLKNLRGKELTDYMNAVGHDNWQKAQDLLRAQGVGLEAELGPLKRAGEEQRVYAQAEIEKSQAGANMKAASERALKASQEANKQFIAGERNKTTISAANIGKEKSEYGADKRLEASKYTADKRSGDVVYRADKALAGVQARARASTDPYTRLQLASLQQRRISTGLELTAAQKTLHDLFASKSQKEEAKAAEMAALSKLQGIEQETIEFAKGLPAMPGVKGKGKKLSDMTLEELQSLRKSMK